MQQSRHETLHAVGLLILRLGIGGFMLTHGWGKMQAVFAGQFDQFGDPIGLGSTLSLILVAFAEFVCALLVMAGLLTRLAAIPVVITMFVAAFVAHAGDPLLMSTAAAQYSAGEADSWVSKQPALMYLIPFFALIFTGPGRFSLDALICARCCKTSNEKETKGASDVATD